MYRLLWRWHQRTEPLPKILSAWPIPRLPTWTSRVNEPLSEKKMNAILTFVNTGRPYGDEQWTEKEAEKHGISFTMRPVGRPRKQRTQPK